MESESKKNNLFSPNAYDPLPCVHIYGIAGSTKYLFKGTLHIRGGKMTTLDELRHLHSYYKEILQETTTSIKRKYYEIIHGLRQVYHHKKNHCVIHKVVRIVARDKYSKLLLQMKILKKSKIYRFDWQIFKFSIGFKSRLSFLNSRNMIFRKIWNI